MKIVDIELAEPFKSLFPRRAEVEADVAEHMAEHGFLRAFPLILWDNVLIDGYHRYYAAVKNKIFDLPAEEMEFDSQDAAELFCIHINAKRRHLTGAELLSLVPKVDRLNRDLAKHKQEAQAHRGKEGARGTPLPHSGARGSRAPQSAQQTADTLRISRRSVEDVREITAHGTEDDMQEVQEGKTTIHKKAEEVKARRRPQRARPEIKDRRTPQMQAFDSAIENMKGVLNQLKAAEWEGINLHLVKQQVSNLLNIVGN